MTAARAPASQPASPLSSAMPTLLPVLAGLSILYGPTYVHLGQTLWQGEANSHAPLVALGVAALLWQLQPSLSALPTPKTPVAGAIILLAALLLATAGHVSDVPQLSMASQIPMLAGILLIFCGGAGIRRAWFPLLFLVFMVPLPGIVLDALTGQLKELLSAISVDVLYALGYPVARNGVVIAIGQYQLFMADACAGLHSIISLAALGLLYTYLATSRCDAQGWQCGGQAAFLLAAIIPIALAANLVRVLLLVLITYHAGDTVGQQWHETLGVLVFLVAVAMLIALDRALLHASSRRAARQAK